MAGRIVNVRRFSLRRPPLEKWCGDLQDQWLKAKVLDLAGESDPWSIVVAVSMLLRLAEEKVPRFQNAMEALRLMKPTLERNAEIRRWERELTQQEREDIRDLGLATVEQLDSRFGELCQYVDPNSQSPAWKSELLFVCHLRDDLEGVALMLEGTLEGNVLVQSLQDLDRRAEHFVELLVEGEDNPYLEDEQLRRVWLSDPDAWWGSPAGIRDESE